MNYELTTYSCANQLVESPALTLTVVGVPCSASSMHALFTSNNTVSVVSVHGQRFTTVGIYSVIWLYIILSAVLHYLQALAKNRWLFLANVSVWITVSATCITVKMKGKGKCITMGGATLR